MFVITQKIKFSSGDGIAPDSLLLLKRAKVVSNTAAIKRDNKTDKTASGIRHCKYLNTIVEQDHRAVKRLMRPMLSFKSLSIAHLGEHLCNPYEVDL